MSLALEPRPDDPARQLLVALVLATIAAVAIVVTLPSHRWLAAGGGIDAGLGLRSMKACGAGVCETLSNRELLARLDQQAGPGRESHGPAFWLAGYGVAGFGLVAAALLVAGGALARAGRPPAPRLAVARLAVTALFLALFAAAVFVASNPSRGSVMRFGVGWAFWVFGIGVVAGIVAAQKLAGLAKAADGEPDVSMFPPQP